MLIANGRYDLVTPYLSSRWLIEVARGPNPAPGRADFFVYQRSTGAGR